MFSPQQEVVLDGELSLNLNIDGEMSLDLHMDGEAGTVIKVTEYDTPTYQGQTTVTPDFEGTVLETAQKTVLSNITVNPIQVESVSNPMGGRTVYIGGII